MFFVIRCIFWLGLVFCHIAGLNTVNPAEIAGKAGVIASNLASNLASGLAQDGAAAAQAQINAAQAQCLAKLSRLAQAAGVGAAVHANAAGVAASTPVPVPRSRDTLLASDRAATHPAKKGGDL